MKLFVITTPTNVYATYYKTIAATFAYTGYDQMLEAQAAARSVAFSYGCTSPSCQLEQIDLPEAKDPQDIFKFLAERHPAK
jgi:hypothetical protein